jgi:hypothetical protein
MAPIRHKLTFAVCNTDGWEMGEQANVENYYPGNKADHVCLAGELARRGARTHAASKLAGST